MVGSTYFFGVELLNSIIAANFPTGNPLNTLTFGVNSVSIEYDPGDVSGDYTYIIVSDNEVNVSASVKEWGLLTVNADGTWFRKQYATGPGTSPDIITVFPEDVSPDTCPIDISSCDESGDWQVQGICKEKLNVTINGRDDTLTGFVYASGSNPNVAVFLLDLGTGNGFMLGLKNPPSHLSENEIGGTYKFVDVWHGGTIGAGNYIIDSSSPYDGTYYHIDQNGIIAMGILTGLQPCNNINNMFYYETMSEPEPGFGDCKVYLVVVDKMIMHFTFKKNATNDFVSYGAGAKL